MKIIKTGDILDIKDARKEIDLIDREMAKLFERRMTASKSVAEFKQKSGLPIEDRQRENAMLEDASKRFQNKEYLPYYFDFLKANMKISKSYQKRLLSGMTVAVSGNEGAFADITAKKVFGNAENEFFSDFSAAYTAAERGECDVAFLPLENSFGGDVGAVLDLMFFGSLYVNGIYESEIVQNLLGVDGADENTIKTVLSHPQGLAQCREFIENAGYETKETATTTAAAKTVFESGDITLGAIASEEAAKTFNLKIIKNHINEQSGNTTRFAVLSRTKKQPLKNDNRFILMFTVKNVAGALSKAISVIGCYEFNLLSLKSRPTKLENWNHYFYVEGEGNIDSQNGKDMLNDLKKCCDNLKVLGSFEKEVKV